RGFLTETRSQGQERRHRQQQQQVTEPLHRTPRGKKGATGSVWLTAPCSLNDVKSYLTSLEPPEANDSSGRKSQRGTEVPAREPPTFLFRGKRTKGLEIPFVRGCLWWQRPMPGVMIA